MNARGEKEDHSTMGWISFYIRAGGTKGRMEGKECLLARQQRAKQEEKQEGAVTVSRS